MHPDTLASQLLCRLRGEAKLACLAGNIDFEQCFDLNVFLSGNAFNPFQQFSGVDRMNNMSMSDNASDLVALKMSDKVPLDISGQSGGLGGQFIRFAFAESALTCVIDGKVSLAGNVLLTAISSAPSGARPALARALAISFFTSLYCSIR